MRECVCVFLCVSVLVDNASVCVCVCSVWCLDKTITLLSVVC